MNDTVFVKIYTANALTKVTHTWKTIETNCNVVENIVQDLHLHEDPELDALILKDIFTDCYKTYCVKEEEDIE
jgi:hypothetical protein